MNSLNDIDLLRITRLKDLKFGSLNWDEMSPARAQYATGKILESVLHRVGV
jgi:hypothetical protein